MTAYRLSPSLPLGQRCSNTGVVLAHVSHAIEDNHVFAAYNIDARMDDDVEIDVRLRSGLLLSLTQGLQNTMEGFLDLDCLLCGGGRSKGNNVAMLNDFGVSISL